MAMYNEDYKYMHYKDKWGETLCYMDNNQPLDKDTVFVTIIATKPFIRENVYGPWDDTFRNTMIAVELTKAYTWEFYDDYEKFCEKYWEAIL